MKEKQIFAGSLEVHTQAREAAIIIKREGKNFCIAPIRPGGAEAYEQCHDSSRYFTLRIEDPRTKRTATIGLGFNAREESLEFKVTVQDFLTQIKREKEAQMRNDADDDTPKLDLKLKEGQKIKIKVPKKNLTSSRKKKSASHKKSSGTGLSLAAPPSGAGRSRRRKKKASSGSDVNASSNSNPEKLGNELLGLNL